MNNILFAIILFSIPFNFTLTTQISQPLLSLLLRFSHTVSILKSKHRSRVMLGESMAEAFFCTHITTIILACTFNPSFPTFQIIINAILRMPNRIIIRILHVFWVCILQMPGTKKIAIIQY